MVLAKNLRPACRPHCLMLNIDGVRIQHAYIKKTVQGKIMAENYTYILKCADGSLYTGWTNHLKERVAAHQSGHGAKYTRGRRPVELVYYETFSTKEEAMSREYAIKHMNRTDKLALIASHPVQEF